MPPAADPTLEEVRGWLTSLSTWGRWGHDDDLGTLNYIGPAERAAALALATRGVGISCALPMTFGGDGSGDTAAADPRDDLAQWAVPSRIVIRDGSEAPDPETRFPAYDAFVIAPHGALVTHLDAPRHTVLRGRSYNDLPVGAGGERGTIEAVRHGIVGRGVLLDVPASQGREWLDDGEAVHPADLEACEQLAGIRVRRGDLLFVRTGYRKRLPAGPVARHAPRPGLHASCLPWLHDREVALVGADVAIDVIPHPYGELGLPIHTVGMWAMGLWLLDNCGLEDLAEQCRDARPSEFLAVVSPLVLPQGTGSPVNPLAIL